MLRSTRCLCCGNYVFPLSLILASDVGGKRELSPFSGRLAFFAESRFNFASPDEATDGIDYSREGALADAKGRSTAPADTLKQNRWHLYHMAGNVADWTRGADTPLYEELSGSLLRRDPEEPRRVAPGVVGSGGPTRGDPTSSAENQAPSQAAVALFRIGEARGSCRGSVTTPPPAGAEGAGARWDQRGGGPQQRGLRPSRHGSAGPREARHARTGHATAGASRKESTVRTSPSSRSTDGVQPSSSVVVS